MVTFCSKACIQKRNSEQAHLSFSYEHPPNTCYGSTGIISRCGFSKWNKR